jgi:multisubunit Na+/H+ antiporter MnhG subunit
VTAPDLALPMAIGLPLIAGTTLAAAAGRRSARAAAWALALVTASGRFVVHELLMVLFLFVTAPVSALMLARAGIHLRLRSRARLPKPKDRA